MTRASTLDEIYLAALTAVRRALDVARAAILLFDADGVLRFKASHGLSDTYRRAAEGHARWARDSIEAEPLLVPDVQRDERLTTLRPVILAEGVRAMAFFPLRQPARLLGQFMAYADVPHAFTAMDVMLGRLIATQVAFAVERAQAEVTRHRLAAIVDSSDDVIVSKTLDGIITSWNHSAERLDGRGRHRKAHHLDHSRRPAQRGRRRAGPSSARRAGGPFRDGPPAQGRQPRRRLDHRLAGARRLWPNVGASKVARDITERRRIEQEREGLLAREQRARADAEAANRAKDDFLITLSHELRTLFLPFNPSRWSEDRLPPASASRLGPRKAETTSR